MATLILSTAGAAVGTALGGPIGGAIGRVVGAAAGSGLDGALFGAGSSPRFVAGPRLSDVAGLSSTEGDPVPRVYGRAKVGGTLIWATRPLEVANTAVARAASASKGGGGAKTVRTTYAYYANLAVGLCEGEIALVRRIWADGTELDLTAITVRVHLGTQDQAPDPLIAAKEGADAPAYRGLAYAVFEGLPLADYGNRIPQFAFEVVRPVNGLAPLVRAVNLIPGSSEFGLDPAPVTVDLGLGRTRAANRFQLQAATDVVASLDALQALCPNLVRVAVVVAWFGDDLRAGHCTIAPRVAIGDKATTGDAWRVAGLGRAMVGTVSRAPDGTPAYGGTPSDAGLARLVADLARRGLGVVLYPFVMMDVAADNALPDPHRAGAAGQPAYPWRGRITCDPAPGLPGSPDGTAAAEAQVQAYFAGPEGYRRQVLHYAALAAAWAAAGAPLAGFVVASELVGLTRVRGADGTYPAVAALTRLAREVRTTLKTSEKLVYAADWTEYGADVRDGGASVRFPLDALFADPSIDAVGIDYYPPISDFRDTPGHADLAETDAIYDRAYLKARLGGGEAFDWFYGDETARLAQARTPITDGAYGKPWTFRAKDLVGWWSNLHVERSGGVETRATAWVPRGKPIWLTEVGVPAVDKGTNGPNVFPDPKSSESAFPPSSRGLRDELIQLRGLEAILSRFDAAAPGFEAADNPISPLYGGPMVDPSRGLRLGLGCAALSGLSRPRLGVGGCRQLARRPLDHRPDRGLRPRPADRTDPVRSRARRAGRDRGRRLPRRHGDRPAALGACRAGTAGPALRARRLGGCRRPALARTAPRSGGHDRCRRPGARLRGRGTAPAGPGRRERPAALDRDRLHRFRKSGLPAGLGRRDPPGRRTPAGDPDRGGRRHAARDRGCPRRGAPRPGHRRPRHRRPDREPAAPGSRTGRPAGDAGRPSADRAHRRRAAGPPIGDPRRAAARGRAAAGDADRNDPAETTTGLGGRALRADPRPARRPGHADDAAIPRRLRRTLARRPRDLARGRPGRTAGAPCHRRLSGLPRPDADAASPGPLWRLDHVARLDVSLRHAGALGSVGLPAMLAGGNLFAVIAPDGTVEIIAAADAVLTAPEAFRLGGLLRGLAGSEAAAARPAPAGSLIVRLDDGAVIPLVDRLDEVGRRFRYRIGPAARDPGDPSYVELFATAGLSALAPLRPVHLRARRESGGVRLSWIGRARRDADAWEPADIPRDEGTETYAVSIFAADGHGLRSLTTAGPSLLYADEAADFGGAQAVLDVAVAQVGAVFGPGASTRARLPVRRA